MKTLIAFLVLVALCTVTACSNENDFDAEEETEAVMSVSQAINDALAVPDAEAILAHFHKDYEGFFIYPEVQFSSTREEFDADSFAEPDLSNWDEYEVIVAPDLAVIKGKSTSTSATFGRLEFYQTSVFKKENGQWKLIHGHTSHNW